MALRASGMRYRLQLTQAQLASAWRRERCFGGGGRIPGERWLMLWSLLDRYRRLAAAPAVAADACVRAGFTLQRPAAPTAVYVPRQETLPLAMFRGARVITGVTDQ